VAAKREFIFPLNPPNREYEKSHIAVRQNTIKSRYIVKIR
jgi:hypothetical protein